MQNRYSAPFKKIVDQQDLRGKRVLLRLDLNVPIVNGAVRDDFRIRRALPTLEMLHERGARTLIVSHLDSGLASSLAPVSEYISRFIEVRSFIARIEDAPKAMNDMQDGDIALLENIRIYPGEKANDPVFAGRLAKLVDYYVNDAFAVSHREHASIVGVPKFIPHFAGPILVEEVEELSKAFDPEHPFLFILGGAKFDTKLPLIEKFLSIADRVFIGGALANDVFRADGYEVGASVVSSTDIDLKHIAENQKLVLPSDVVVESDLGKLVKAPDQVAKNERIMDAGPKSVEDIAEILKTAELVLWNGPVGYYEKGFSEGTEAIARAIAASRAKSIVGGGDTVAAIAKLGILNKFGFVSTGGGAMIEFLAQGTLPGIEALKTS